MKFETLLYKILLTWFAVLCCLALVGVDLFHDSVLYREDMFRNGQARYLLFAFIAVCTWTLCRCNPAWAIFWGYTFLLWAVNDWPSYGVLDVILIAAALVTGDAIRRLYKETYVVLALACLAAAESVYGILQSFGIDPYFGVANGFIARNRVEAYGTLGQNTLLGAFAGIGFLIFIGLKPTTRTRAAFLWAGVILCGTAVIVSHSSMAILGTGAGYWYLLWRRNWKFTIALSLVGMATFAAAFTKYKDAEFFGLSGREVLWPQVINVWMRSPYFGNGPGFWAGGLPTFNIQGMGYHRWYQVHNDFLQVLPEQGAVGLIIVLTGILLFFSKARTMDPIFGALGLALCVGCLGNFLMHVTCFGLIAAWIVTCAHHHKDTPCKKFA